MNKLKVIFMGTPDFAVPCLKALHKNHEILAVITQPDRRKGRGQKVIYSPVKEFASSVNLTVLQPEKIKTDKFEDLIESLQPDLIVVVAFGQILSKRILDIPVLGCINVHASLLPMLRGAAPIHWAVINGEKKTGVTTMFMDVGLDTGDMLLKKDVYIADEDDTGVIHDKLMILGAETLLETITLLQMNKLSRVKQDESKSTYAPLLTKKLEKITWDKDALQIHNLIRGLSPWPGSYCMNKEAVLKLWKSKVVNEEPHSYEPGTVIDFTKNGFIVAAGEGILDIMEVQPANKRRMHAKDYINGHGIRLNDVLK